MSFAAFSACGFCAVIRMWRCAWGVNVGQTRSQEPRHLRTRERSRSSTSQRDHGPAARAWTQRCSCSQVVSENNFHLICKHFASERKHTMSKKVRGGYWITAGVGAMALAGLVSCADVTDDQAPDDPGHQT